MKKIIPILLVIAPILFFGGCKTTEKQVYEDSLNLNQVEKWVLNEVPIDDQKILKESKKFFMRVVTVVVRNKQQGMFAKIEKGGNENGFSAERIKSDIIFVIAVETTGGLYDPAFDSLYYEVYETIMRKKKLDVDVLLFRFYTEGFGMRPDDYDTLREKGYFQGVEKLAQNSRAY